MPRWAPRLAMTAEGCLSDHLSQVRRYHFHCYYFHVRLRCRVLLRVGGGAAECDSSLPLGRWRIDCSGCRWASRCRQGCWWSSRPWRPGWRTCTSWKSRSWRARRARATRRRALCSSTVWLCTRRRTPSIYEEAVSSAIRSIDIHCLNISLFKSITIAAAVAAANVCDSLKSLLDDMVDRSLVEPSFWLLLLCSLSARVFQTSTSEISSRSKTLCLGIL